MHGFIPTVSAQSGETGPEFSLQNTRQISPGTFRTATAGIQYRANPYSPNVNTWAVWRESEAGVGGWHTFLTQKLEPATWYKITLEADYTLNKYRTFSLSGGSLNVEVDLSPYNIALESKFSEEAFWATLENENLWNNCGEAGIFDYQIHYDNLTVTKKNN